MARSLKLAGQALAVGAVAGLLALLVWRVVHQPKPVKAGARAPAFNLTRLDGNGRISLAALDGKVRVVNFWATWCAPCKAETPALERFWRQFRSRGVVVLGVDYNDVAGDARRFVRRHGLTYPMVRDPGGTVATRYNLTGVPETFVIDRQGRVAAIRRYPVDQAWLNRELPRLLAEKA
jgi:cytochrome c biogenesis protein CcmG/thiol:disulfide interchange protein DsbE